MADGIDNIRVIPLADLVGEISASGTATSEVIDLNKLRASGFFSLEFVTTGSGTLKAEYLMSSTSTGTFVEPEGASDITTTLATGTKIVGFNTDPAPFMKIKLTEDGGASSVTVTTCKFMVQ